MVAVNETVGALALAVPILAAWVIGGILAVKDFLARPSLLGGLWVVVVIVGGALFGAAYIVARRMFRSLWPRFGQDGEQVEH